MSMASRLHFPFFRNREHDSGATADIGAIGYKAAVAALEDAGFWVLREGVHVIMTDGTRILTIPCQDPLNRITVEGIVRDAGLSAQKFHQLL